MPKVYISAQSMGNPGLDKRITRDLHSGLNSANPKSNGFGYFEPSDTFTYNGTEFTFKQACLFEVRPDHNYRLTFIGPELGNGGSATVNKVDSVIDVSPLNCHPLTSGEDVQAKAIKKQVHCGCPTEIREANCLLIDHKPIASLQAEYDISAKAPHLGVEKPVIVNKNSRHISFMIMNQFPGRELFFILSEDIDKVRPLSLKNRMQLTIAIYSAYLSQVLKLGIIHGDVKPENVIVNSQLEIDSTTEAAASTDQNLSASSMKGVHGSGPNNLEYEVNFIDFAFAVQPPPGEKRLFLAQMGGTNTYMPPETLFSPKGMRVQIALGSYDLYSITRMLLLIWGGIDRSYTNEGALEHRKALSRDDMIGKLFRSLPIEQLKDLKRLGLAQDIKMLFTLGLNTTPEHRGSVQDSLATFERVYQGYLAATKSQGTAASADSYTRAAQALGEQPSPIAAVPIEPGAEGGHDAGQQHPAVPESQGSAPPGGSYALVAQALGRRSSPIEAAPREPVVSESHSPALFKRHSSSASVDPDAWFLGPCVVS